MLVRVEPEGDGSASCCGHARDQWDMGREVGCDRLLHGRALVSESLSYGGEDFIGEGLVVNRARERD
jgi:hypothetical protein